MQKDFIFSTELDILKKNDVESDCHVKEIQRGKFQRL